MTNDEETQKAAADDVLDYKHHSTAFSIAYGITLLTIIIAAVALMGVGGMFYIFMAPTYSIPTFIVILCLLSLKSLRRFIEHNIILTILIMFLIGALSPLLFVGIHDGLEKLAKMSLERIIKDGVVLGGGIGGAFLALIYTPILRIIRRKYLPKSN